MRSSPWGNTTGLSTEPGFSLVELMMVVAIIAVLAAVGIPNYITYQNRSRQSEARILLSGVYSSETVYFAEHSRYARSYDEINFRPSSEPKYYKNWYLNISGNANHFTASCSADLDHDGHNDCWLVTDCNRDPWNVYDDLNDKYSIYPYRCH
jgi:prepilin-type N-terminal cleavage/methylation domain-containing protein